MTTSLRETSVLKEISYLDPELNGDAEYFRVRARGVTLWRQVRQFVCSPVVLAVVVLTVLLMLAVNLPS